MQKRFSEFFQSSAPTLSVELFPPKTPWGLQRAKETVAAFDPFALDFITVTYGAGGGTREHTRMLTEHFARERKQQVAAHLTCVDHSPEEILELARSYESIGINKLVALRGDLRKDEARKGKNQDGFSCARDLVQFLRKNTAMSFAVAGYPERHPESPNWESEIAYLKEKVDAGADIIVTQLFFDTERYFTFVERTRRAGIQVPILPGLMPVSNLAQVRRFTEMCGATLPQVVIERLESLRDNPGGLEQYGAELCLELSQNLLAGGAPGIHFYTLNKSVQVAAVLKELRRSHPLHEGALTSL